MSYSRSATRQTSEYQIELISVNIYRDRQKVPSLSILPHKKSTVMFNICASLPHLKRMDKFPPFHLNPIVLRHISIGLDLQN